MYFFTTGKNWTFLTHFCIIFSSFQKSCKTIAFERVKKEEIVLSWKLYSKRYELFLVACKEASFLSLVRFTFFLDPFANCSLVNEITLLHKLLNSFIILSKSELYFCPASTYWKWKGKWQNIERDKVLHSIWRQRPV